VTLKKLLLKQCQPDALAFETPEIGSFPSIADSGPKAT
jgi:hypothetical protein